MWLNLQVVATYETCVLDFTLLNQGQASQGETNLILMHEISFCLMMSMGPL